MKNSIPAEFQADKKDHKSGFQTNEEAMETHETLYQRVESRHEMDSICTVVNQYQ
jgi:hypothetical protein